MRWKAPSSAAATRTPAASLAVAGGIERLHRRRAGRAPGQPDSSVNDSMLVPVLRSRRRPPRAGPRPRGSDRRPRRRRGREPRRTQQAGAVWRRARTHNPAARAGWPLGSVSPGSPGWMQPECIEVARVEDGLDRAPPDAPAAHPDEWTQPNRQPRGLHGVAGRHGVEVAGKHVKAILVARHATEQRTQFEHPAPLGPCGMDRAEVHAEEAQPFAGRHHLDERMPREPGSRPPAVRHRLAAEEAE